MATSPLTDRVLVADDDADLLALTAFALRNAGFDVLTVPDGTRALAELSSSPFTLAVLDVTMPGLNGFAVCEQLRTRSALPVIMLSARNQEADIVHALEIGADDYITKPFSPRTLIARIRALLRRTVTGDTTVLESAGAALNLESRTLNVAGVDLNLTPLETSVLHMLFKHAGRLVATERLATEAWGRAGYQERHALKQVIYRLRRKLEEQTPHAALLETTRNAGYRWAPHTPSSDAPARSPG
jgi:DNA-binding response OmpR family regulator